jgi:hypothetical protein
MRENVKYAKGEKYFKKFRKACLFCVVLCSIPVFARVFCKIMIVQKLKL